MSLLGFRLLSGQAFFIVDRKLLVTSDLVLILNNRSLQGGLLQNLSLLVGVDLLFGDQLIERFLGIFGEDAIQFGGSVLSEPSVSVRLD